MKRAMLGWMAACMVLLSGCASSVIRSEVTAFHEWPADLRDKSYVFERTREQDNDLQYRSYENLVRAQLQRLGFTEAGVNAKPALTATLGYRVDERDVREVQPVVINSGPAWGAAYYGPRWPGYAFYDPFFYDPFWYAPQVVGYQDTSYRLYTRQLQITLARSRDMKKLYEVTVVSKGRSASLAAVMPYMVQSAFADFPGPSGVPRRVELPFKQ